MSEPMTPELETARVLLDATYEGLDLTGGDLAEATDRPSATNASAWVEKGEWLALASRVGAEKVFFVENNPVAVFSKLGETNHTQWLEVFTRVWCMARPQLLFLAKEGDLSVYNLTRSPSRPSRAVDEKSKNDREKNRQERLLDSVQTAAEVQTKLQKYRREQIESGQLFEDKRFGYDQRADHALIRDLQKIRKALLDSKLDVEYAHALIGRSIFIRYLEDRKVLNLDYLQRTLAQRRVHRPVRFGRLREDHPASRQQVRLLVGEEDGVHRAGPSGRLEPGRRADRPAGEIRRR
jgi:hypothetical protein